MRMWLALGATASAVAQEAPQDEDASNEIVVVGVRKAEGDIVVRGAPRCYDRDGDPFDTVPVPRGIGVQSVIGPDATGTVRWHPDDEPILGPSVWQRTGNAIGDYRFRVPADGTKPLCIGALPFATQGFGQLRRIVTAEGMHGRYLHFSARVQTRKAGEVRFWLATGDAHNRRYRGGDTRHQPIRGPATGNRSTSSSGRCRPMPTMSATAFSCRDAATPGSPIRSWTC